MRIVLTFAFVLLGLVLADELCSDALFQDESACKQLVARHNVPCFWNASTAACSLVSCPNLRSNCIDFRDHPYNCMHKLISNNLFYNLSLCYTFPISAIATESDSIDAIFVVDTNFPSDDSVLQPSLLHQFYANYIETVSSVLANKRLRTGLILFSNHSHVARVLEHYNPSNPSTANVDSTLSTISHATHVLSVSSVSSGNDVNIIDALFDAFSLFYKDTFSPAAKHIFLLSHSVPTSSSVPSVCDSDHWDVPQLFSSNNISFHTLLINNFFSHISSHFDCFSNHTHPTTHSMHTHQISLSNLSFPLQPTHALHRIVSKTLSHILSQGSHTSNTSSSDPSNTPNTPNTPNTAETAETADIEDIADEEEFEYVRAMLDLFNASNETLGPSVAPTGSPTIPPTVPPTGSPTESPTGSPTRGPTRAPTDNTRAPTESPTTGPTSGPTEAPTGSPTRGPTRSPVEIVTENPSPQPTNGPIPLPTRVPTALPVVSPVTSPTSVPSLNPSKGTFETSSDGSYVPTSLPTTAFESTDAQTRVPSQAFESTVGATSNIWSTSGTTSGGWWHAKDSSDSSDSDGVMIESSFRVKVDKRKAVDTDITIDKEELKRMYENYKKTGEEMDLSQVLSIDGDESKVQILDVNDESGEKDVNVVKEIGIDIYVENQKKK